MAFTLADLLVKIGIKGADEVKTELKQTDDAVKKTASSINEMGASAARSEVPILGLAGTLGALTISSTQLAAGIGALSGLRLAAQYQRLEVGFTALLGSADKARRLMADLKQMGEDTPFNTMQLVQFSRTLLAMGSTAENVSRQMRSIANTGAAVGLNDSELGNLTRMLSELRMRPHAEIREIGALGASGLPLVSTVNAGAGKNFQTPDQAERFLASMSGSKAFDVLIAGMDKAFGGAAAQNAGTLLGVFENLGEAWSNVMLPTGRALIPVFTVLGTGAKMLGDALGKVNDVTGGSGGLILMTLGLFRAKNLLIGSVIGAWRWTQNLTKALNEYSVAATKATASSKASGAAEAGAAAAGGAAAAAGRFGKIGAGLKAMGPQAIGFIADLGLNMIGDQIGGKVGDTLKGIGTGVGLGSLGFLFGPEVGIPTTILGALIGGIQGFRNSGDSPAERTANATERMAASLDEIRSTLIGGGSRARTATSVIEDRINLARSLAKGIA